MKIDLPIVIVFDASGIAQRDLDRAASARVCTLRYDTEDCNVPAQLFDHYPPKDDDKRLGEPGDAILTVLSSRADAAIKAKAARNPVDYMVGTQAERDAAQAEVDEQRAANGQFGVGA